MVMKQFEKNRIEIVETVYGLLFVELDSMYGERNFVAAYGDLKKVQHYKEECNLKGVIKEYKTQHWLVKRLEYLKEEYKEDVRLLYIK